MLLTTDEPRLGKSRQRFTWTIFYQVCWQLPLSLCSLNYTTALCFSFLSILALIFFLLSHRQGFPQLLLLRRNTTFRPSLLAIRALGLVFRRRNQSCSYSGPRKFALEKSFIYAVVAELVHGLEKEISDRVQRRSKLRAIFGVGLERDCQRQMRAADSSAFAEIFHPDICWGPW